ncbi:MAG: ribonuclease HII [Reyranella sp.]|uniref:ribonuclease HII n=1 Tax=Reyranella sp. TaxID=1929291 RepID=UPI00120E0624|nr:ribonuclease HII [Reyranella sp.]TAJ41515.1 MAG: ribonuclease HII [Reyranella sp.]
MPSFRFELRCDGRVAGIDEAGRGPLAGPVYAAAAVIDRARATRKLLKLIDDSKKLTHERREEAYEAMIASGAVQFAIAEASVEEIDRINILQATFLAMRRAVQALAEPPVVALVDGNRVPPGLACRAETIVGGDAHSYSIAAASIFAKVARDRHMTKLAETFPGYGWESNRGYGSAQHLKALELLGPTPHHRMSFAPLSRLV